MGQWESVTPGDHTHRTVPILWQVLLHNPTRGLPGKSERSLRKRLSMVLHSEDSSQCWNFTRTHFSTIPWDQTLISRRGRSKKNGRLRLLIEIYCNNKKRTECKATHGEWQDHVLKPILLLEGWEHYEDHTPKIQVHGGCLRLRLNQKIREQPLYTCTSIPTLPHTTVINGA